MGVNLGWGTALLIDEDVTALLLSGEMNGLDSSPFIR